MREVLCYAYGYEGHWQAICVDLDIAIEGRSRREVEDAMNRAVRSYVEDALKESPAARDRLLKRRSPLWVRAKMWLWLQIYLFRHRQAHKNTVSVIGVPCHA